MIIDFRIVQFYRNEPVQMTDSEGNAVTVNQRVYTSYTLQALKLGADKFPVWSDIQMIELELPTEKEAETSNEQ